MPFVHLKGTREGDGICGVIPNENNWIPSWRALLQGREQNVCPMVTSRKSSPFKREHLYAVLTPKATWSGVNGTEYCSLIFSCFDTLDTIDNIAEKMY